MKVSERLRDLAAAQTKCKCGAHAMMHQRADQTEWQVTCSLCKVAARKRKTRVGALSAWVRRVTPNAEISARRCDGLPCYAASILDMGVPSVYAD